MGVPKEFTSEDVKERSPQVEHLTRHALPPA